MRQRHKLYVGMHDGVCTVTSSDGGETWQQGRITPLAHAAARHVERAVRPAEKQEHMRALDARKQARDRESPSIVTR